MKGKGERYPDYPLFKGLQRPLEFLGIQGRYIYWAAVTTCGAIVGFVAAYCLLGFIAGLVVLAAVVSAGIVLILLKQRKGLHSKKVVPGVYVYAHSRRSDERKTITAMCMALLIVERGRVCLEARRTCPYLITRISK